MEDWFKLNDPDRPREVDILCNECGSGLGLRFCRCGCGAQLCRHCALRHQGIDPFSEERARAIRDKEFDRQDRERAERWRIDNEPKPDPDDAA